MSPHTPYRTPARRLPLLDDVRIATPCDATWSGMLGDDRVRWCPSCEKNVYNLSAMTRADAEQLLSETSDLCVRLFRRADGTVLTADCPVGVKKRQRKRRGLALAGASAMTIAATAATGLAPAPAPQPVAPTPTGAVVVPSPLPLAPDHSFATLGMGMGMGMLAAPAVPVLEVDKDGVDVIRPRSRNRR